MALTPEPHEATPERHEQSARRHDAAAERHADSATFWDKQGDVERAILQRDLAAYEREGAVLQRRWADLLQRSTRTLD